MHQIVWLYIIWDRSSLHSKFAHSSVCYCTTMWPIGTLTGLAFTLSFVAWTPNNNNHKNSYLRHACSLFRAEPKPHPPHMTHATALLYLLLKPVLFKAEPKPQTMVSASSRGRLFGFLGLGDQHISPTSTARCTAPPTSRSTGRGSRSKDSDRAEQNEADSPYATTNVHRFSIPMEHTPYDWERERRGKKRDCETWKWS